MLEIIGGPDRDRTGDLFHAMEARSQLRHRPTLRKDCIYSQTCGPLSQTLVRVSQITPMAQDGRGGDWEARIVVGSD